MTAGIATVALAAGALAPVAGAHNGKYDTTITAKVKKAGKDATLFDGAVESTKAKCVADRKVKLFQVVDNADDTLIGTASTDAEGAWQLIPTPKPFDGAYYALAAKKVLKKSAKHRHICKRAASEELKVK